MKSDPFKRQKWISCSTFPAGVETSWVLELACGGSMALKSPSADRIVDQRSGCSGIWATILTISRKPASELPVIGKSSHGLRLDQPRPPSQHVSQMVWHREQISLLRCSISLPPQTGHEGGHDSRLCSCFGEAGVFGESMIAPLAGTAGSRAATTMGVDVFHPKELQGISKVHDSSGSRLFHFPRECEAPRRASSFSPDNASLGGSLAPGCLALFRRSVGLAQRDAVPLLLPVSQATGSAGDARRAGACLGARASRERTQPHQEVLHVARGTNRRP